MNEDLYKKLPQMLGIKWVQDCLGVKRATIYRRLDDGSMMPPVKIGSINRWPKDYIRKVMERGFEPRGTHKSWKKKCADGGERAPTAP